MEAKAKRKTRIDEEKNEKHSKEEEKKEYSSLVSKVLSAPPTALQAVDRRLCSVGAEILPHTNRREVCSAATVIMVDIQVCFRNYRHSPLKGPRC
jgi:hypothetical protein